MTDLNTIGEWKAYLDGRLCWHGDTIHINPPTEFIGELRAFVESEYPKAIIASTDTRIIIIGKGGS